MRSRCSGAQRTGDIAVENNYLHLTNGRVEYAAGGGRVIIPSGRFALGYPRADGGEEINASIRVENMPMRPLKEAFDADRLAGGRHR